MQLDAIEEFSEPIRRPRVYRHDPRRSESLREALEVFDLRMTRRVQLDQPQVVPLDERA